MPGSRVRVSPRARGVVLYYAKWQCNKNMTARGGGENHDFTNWLSLQCGAFNRDLLDERLNSPLVSGARGVVTND